MTRIQIELTPEKVAEIEAVMEQCGVRTKKDFINNALTLLDWAIRERSKGNLIASVNENEDRFQEVLLPIFTNVLTKQPA